MSEQIGIHAPVDDPDYLVTRANALLSPGGTGAAPAPALTLDEAMRQAYDLISADYYLIDRLKQARVEPDYPNLITAQVSEKIAAFTFLAQRKLLALAAGAGGSDNRELAVYVEILFRLKAVDALILLYDFAALRLSDENTAAYWHNVTSRCLYLMALLAEARPRVLAFLTERAEARLAVEELAASPKPEIAAPLRALLQASRDEASPVSAPAPAPAYLTIYNRLYARVDGNLSARQEALELEVMEQVRTALENDAVVEIAETLAHGSEAEATIAFDALTTFASGELLIDVLEEVLNSIGVDPVRLAACILALGKLNRASNIRGGMLRINRLLHATARTVMEDCVGVARLAVRELAAMDAVIDIERLLEEATFLPVGEEAIVALKNARVLSTSIGFLEDRPDLRPAFLAARAELLEVRNLMEAAYAAATEDITLNYLKRLQEMNALPELRKLSQGNSKVSQLSQRILRQIEEGK